MSSSDRLLSFHEEGHSAVSDPASPGELNVFYLKAQESTLVVMALKPAMDKWDPRKPKGLCITFNSII